MQSLQTLIDMLTAGRALHINILDLGGILKTEATVISTKNTIHSKEFCDVAKKRRRGGQRMGRDRGGGRGGDCSGRGTGRLYEAGDYPQ